MSELQTHAIEYELADGRTFVMHFLAESFEEADQHLAGVRRSARLLGQHVETIDAEVDVE